MNEDDVKPIRELSLSQVQNGVGYVKFDLLEEKRKSVNFLLDKLEANINEYGDDETKSSTLHLIIGLRKLLE